MNDLFCFNNKKRRRVNVFSLLTFFSSDKNINRADKVSFFVENFVDILLITCVNSKWDYFSCFIFGMDSIILLL